MEVMINRIGHKLEGKMKPKHLIINLILSNFIISCTQLEEVSEENVTSKEKIDNETAFLPEAVNEENVVLLEESNKKTILPKKNSSYISGGSFNTISIEQDNKTLVCIKYSGIIKDGVFIDLDTSEVPIIRIQSVGVDPNQLKVCNEFFNTQEYTHTAIFLEDFHYTVNGYVFKNDDTKIFTENGKMIGLDLNDDNKSDYLNTCSSIESEHLSVWDSELKKARLAYAYRRIDADLIETCNDIDYPKDI